MVSILSSLAIVHRIFTNNVTEKLIIVNSDDRSKDDDENLNAKPAPCTLDSKQANNNIFNLELPPILCYHTVNKRDNGISDDKSILVSKQQRSASPCPTLHYTSMPPLL